MFVPGSVLTNTNLPLTAMNHNLHQQQFLFDNLKDHRSNKFSSPMSRKTSATPNFSLDPEILRELNARYLHDINATRSTSAGNSNLDGNGLPTFPLPPFLRAEHYHQHTHTHEHNLNILTAPNNSLLNGNTFLDKLSKADNGLSPFLRTTTANNFSLPPPAPIFPPFSLINNPTTNSSTNNNHSTKETASPPAKKSGKWSAAHVRISWMIFHQQQRSKDKLSPSDTKKDEETQSSNQKLPDQISNTKPLLPPPLPSTNESSLPLPSSYPTPLLPPPAFNYRSPFDFVAMNNGPFGRVPPSSSSAFGGLGSLFPPPPPPSLSSSTMDRKSEMNGSAAAAAALGLDWSRFHRGIGPSPLIPPLTPLSSTNDNSSSKKVDETSNSNNDKKRSSSVLNDDDRRNSHHHLMLPPSHLTNNNNYSSSSSSLNRPRSRSPHPSVHPHHHHHHSSSSLTNKNSSSSSSPPSLHSSSSSSRKRNSPNMKPNLSDISKNSSHPPPPPPSSVPLPPAFGAFDPLTLSIIERQRLSAAYASLFAAASQPNGYFPGHMDPGTFRNNGSSSLFPNLDSSAMTAALLQREHFLNSIRQQQEQIERERAAVSSLSKISKPPAASLLLSSTPTANVVPLKSEPTSPKHPLEETPRITSKVATSPGSHSSTSSSSSLSKKAKHVKREHKSPTPPASSTTETTDTILKEESNVELTPSITTAT